MMTPIICAGAGGHASVMIPLAEACNFRVVGVWARDYGEGYRHRFSPPLVSDLRTFCAEYNVQFACVGVGSTDRQTMAKRIEIFQTLRAHHLSIALLVHASALLPDRTFYGEGLTIMQGVIVQPHVRFGANVLVNTGAIIEHGCIIGDHVHIASGAILGGDVIVGDASHIGIGAVIRQGITIGKNACVGAGAVVVKDVLDGATVVGNPARELPKETGQDKWRKAGWRVAPDTETEIVGWRRADDPSV